MSGIHTDIRSGKGAESRKKLRRLSEGCYQGAIICVVTKSVGRFGRNTIEKLGMCRKLKEKDIDGYFMMENTRSMGEEGELSLTLSCAIAQSESCNKSKNIEWGLEKSGQKPGSKLCNTICYGYRKAISRIHDRTG